MDAFYASVEAKEQPQLRGLPVVVGGTGRRGVVASASYEARSFGVRSAMPTAQARRLCPQGVFLSPRFSVYHAYSERLHDVLRGFTPLVEGIALDEAFCDVSGCSGLFGPPEAIAAELHRRVNAELGLPCSVGVGPNKLVAKLASKAAKPGPGSSHGRDRGPRPGPGTVVVRAGEVLGFIWPLPAQALWGIGPASAERLRNLGVATVGELAALPEELVVNALGRAAGHLVHELAWGRDERPVDPERAVKSIGHEETYPYDIFDPEQLRQRLAVMAGSVAASTRAQGLVARTVTMKLRYGDFVTITRSLTFARPHADGRALADAAAKLLADLDLSKGARLLGVSVSGLLAASALPGEQLQLDLGAQGGAGARPTGAGSTGAGSTGAPPGGGAPSLASGPVPPGHRPAWEQAYKAVDAVRARFGEGAVGPATGPEPPR